MAKYFDEQRWCQELTKPDWYIYIDSEHKRLRQLCQQRPQKADVIKQEFKNFLIERLNKDEIYLADEGPNQDAERQPIDRVVIHHTSHSQPYDLERLNVTHLLNLYAAYYAHPYNPNDTKLKGQPIWSNHVRKGRQVFYAYHWLVRRDGRVERLLEDQEIGWQAGNWAINCRSVGLCFDNDYASSSPSEIEIKAMASLIKKHYPNVCRENILGHKEVNPKTTCPGEGFLSGWKKLLLEAIYG